MAKKKRKKTHYATKINPNDPLNWWNKFWFIAFAVGLLFEGCGIAFFSDKFSANSIVMFPFLIIIVLVAFQYRQLRKKIVFRIWGVISIGLFAVFLYSTIRPNIFSEDYLYALKTLKIPLVFLILFSVFRSIAKLTYGTELIIPPKGSRFDSDEGRKVNLLDILSAILYAPIIMLCMLY